MRDVRQITKHALDDQLEITATEPLGGGDISESALVETTDGQLVVKWHDSGPPEMFLREAEALRRMRAAESGLVIPEPLAATEPDGEYPATLVLEYIEPGRRAPDFDERLGRGLARLHAESADAYGFDHDNYCGTTPQPNDWTDDWVDFYGEKRLLHQLRLCVDRRGFISSQRRTFERLVERLDALVGGAEHPPALIHGDLWSGNLHTATDGAPSILDPAAYYGHPEAEIGMMELFGGFSQTVYDAYEEIRPLPDGWRNRVSLYSLYHVMNHYYLFGGHYGRRAVRIAEEWT